VGDDFSNNGNDLIAMPRIMDDTHLNIDNHECRDRPINKKSHVVTLIEAIWSAWMAGFLSDSRPDRLGQ
jgi:hypothetical protein